MSSPDALLSRYSVSGDFEILKRALCALSFPFFLSKYTTYIEEMKNLFQRRRDETTRRSNTRRTVCAPRNSQRTLLLSLAKPEFKYLPDVWRVYHFVNLRFTVMLLSRSLVRSRRRRRRSSASDLSRLSFPQLEAIYV